MDSSPPTRSPPRKPPPARPPPPPGPPTAVSPLTAHAVSPPLSPTFKTALPPPSRPPRRTASPVHTTPQQRGYAHTVGVGSAPSGPPRRSASPPPDELPALPGGSGQPSPPVSPLAVSSSPPDELTTTNTHRVTSLIREMIDTEESYVSQLDLVIKHYIVPLRDKRVLTPAQLVAVFSNLEALRAANGDLLQDWRDWRDSVGSESAGGAAAASCGKPISILLAHLNNLKVYVVYCANQLRAGKEVTALLKSSAAFSDHCKNARVLPDVRFLDIEDFLIMPMQRLCRYPLFLAEIIKCTARADGMLDTAKEALSAARQLVDTVNTAVHKAQTASALLAIHRRLQNSHEFPLLQMGRDLVLEGTLKVQARYMHLFLFTDSLLMCLRRRNDLVGKRMISLSMVVLFDLPDCKDDKYSFEIGEVGHKIYHVHADSEVTKRSWFAALSAGTSKYRGQKAKRKSVAILRQQQVLHTSSRMLAERGGSGIGYSVRTAPRLESTSPPSQVSESLSSSTGQRAWFQLREQTRGALPTRTRPAIPFDRSNSEAALRRGSKSTASVSSSAPGDIPKASSPPRKKGSHTASPASPPPHSSFPGLGTSPTLNIQALVTELEQERALRKKAEEQAAACEEMLEALKSSKQFLVEHLAAVESGGVDTPTPQRSTRSLDEKVEELQSVIMNLSRENARLRMKVKELKEARTPAPVASTASG